MAETNYKATNNSTEIELTEGGKPLLRLMLIEGQWWIEITNHKLMRVIDVLEVALKNVKEQNND